MATQERSAAAVACFVSPHGFGHAARACAVLEALRDLLPAVRCEIFTTTPRWFFADSLGGGFAYHRAAVDVGLVQRTALEEDLPATVRRLRQLAPPSAARRRRLAAQVQAAGCRLVVADIAPLGLAVAHDLALPSLLVESFTWDWIYAAYAAREPALAEAGERLAPLFRLATRRVQTEPLCRPVAGALRVPPVSRRPRAGRAEVRRRLGVPEDVPLVLVTMGGIAWDYEDLECRLRDLDRTAAGPWLLLPGAAATPRVSGRVVRLPHRSGFLHPDLVGAADAVVGKLGYSTVAEVERAGVPFGYVPRPGFAESPILERWVQARLPYRRIDPARFTAGDWLADAAALVQLPRRPAPVDAPQEDGATAVARVAAELLHGTGAGRRG